MSVPVKYISVTSAGRALARSFVFFTLSATTLIPGNAARWTSNLNGKEDRASRYGDWDSEKEVADTVKNPSGRLSFSMMLPKMPPMRPPIPPVQPAIMKPGPPIPGARPTTMHGPQIAWPFPAADTDGPSAGTLPAYPPGLFPGEAPPLPRPDPIMSDNEVQFSDFLLDIGEDLALKQELALVNDQFWQLLLAGDSEAFGTYYRSLLEVGPLYSAVTKEEAKEQASLNLEFWKKQLADDLDRSGKFWRDILEKTSPMDSPVAETAEETVAKAQLTAAQTALKSAQKAQRNLKEANLEFTTKTRQLADARIDEGKLSSALANTEKLATAGDAQQAALIPRFAQDVALAKAYISEMETQVQRVTRVKSTLEVAMRKSMEEVKVELLRANAVMFVPK